MFPNIKNFSLPSKQKTTNCYVCQDNLIVSALCAMCGNSVCKNKCCYTIFASDIKDKPWLSNYLGKNICLNCLPKTSTASDQYIKTVFAEIFSNEDSILPGENEIENSLELQRNIEENPQTKAKPLSEEIEDQFIGAILNDLFHHGNINFNMDGKLDSQSVRNIVNSFEEILAHPIMS